MSVLVVSWKKDEMMTLAALSARKFHLCCCASQSDANLSYLKIRGLLRRSFSDNKEGMGEQLERGMYYGFMSFLPPDPSFISVVQIGLYRLYHRY